MIETQNYIVTREVALRTGQQPYKYRTQDGRYIVDARTLGRIRMTAEEYVTGIQGIEPITKEEANTLIAQGGYVMGDEQPKAQNSTNKPQEEPIEEEVVESPIESEETAENENNNNEDEEVVEKKTTKKGGK